MHKDKNRGRVADCLSLLRHGHASLCASSPKPTPVAGGRAEVDKIINEQKARTPRRPALIDELSKLEK